MILTRVISSNKIKTRQCYTDNINKCSQQLRGLGKIEQFVAHTNQSIMYSSTVVQSRSVTGISLESVRRLILLYNGLISNCNAKDGSSASSLVRGTCIKGTIRLKGGCNESGKRM